MIELGAEALSPVLDFMPAGSVQTTVVLMLLVGVLYFRKALGIGSVLADWVGRVVFTMVVLLGLLITGIIPRVNVDAAASLIGRVVDLVTGVAT